MGQHHSTMAQDDGASRWLLRRWECVPSLNKLVHLLPAGGEEAKEEEKKEAAPPEPEEDSDDDFGLSLFD